MSVNAAEITKEVAETVANHASTHGEGFLSLNDTHTWILFSFIIFLAIMWLKTRKIICNLLDDRTKRIKKELEEAENLRKEAQKMLESYKDINKKASAEAKKIIEDAEKYAKDLKEQSETDARYLAKKRETSLRIRINKAENEAIKKINSLVINIATASAYKVIESHLKDKKDFIDKSIDGIPNKF